MSKIILEGNRRLKYNNFSAISLVGWEEGRLQLGQGNGNQVEQNGRISLQSDCNSIEVLSAK